MIVRLLGFLAATLVPVVSGFCLLSLLRRPGMTSRSWLEQAPLSYLVGIASFAVETYAFGIVGVPTTFWTLLAVQAAPLALLGLQRSLWPAAPIFGQTRPEAENARLPGWAWGLAILVAAKIVYVFAMNASELRRTDDAFKTAVAVARHTFLYKDHSAFQTILGYPKFPGFVLFWFGSAFGRWDEFAMNFAHFNYFLALLLLFFATLRTAVGVAPALVATYALSAMPLFASHSILIGYADQPMGLYLTFAGIYAWRFARTGQWDDCIVALFFVCTLPLWKNEGKVPFFPLGVYILAAALAYRKQWIAPRTLWATSLALIGVGALALAALARLYDGATPPFMPSHLWTAIRPGNHWAEIRLPLAQHFGWEYNNWMIVGGLAALAIPFLPLRVLRRPETVHVLFSFFLLASFVYLFAFGAAYEYLVQGTTVNRTFLQIVPSFLFSCTLALAASDTPTQNSARGSGRSCATA